MNCLILLLWCMISGLLQCFRLLIYKNSEHLLKRIIAIPGMLSRVTYTAAVNVGCGGRLKVLSAFATATGGAPITGSCRLISDLSAERAARPIEKRIHGNEQPTSTG